MTRTDALVALFAESIAFGCFFSLFVTARTPLKRAGMIMWGSIAAMVSADASLHLPGQIVAVWCAVSILPGFIFRKNSSISEFIIVKLSLWLQTVVVAQLVRASV